MLSLGILSTAFYGYCLTHFYYSFRYNINLLDHIKKYNTTRHIQNSISNLRYNNTILLDLDDLLFQTEDNCNNHKYNNFTPYTSYRNSIERKSDMLNELRNRFNSDSISNNNDNSLSETDISDNEYEIVN
jgi:hypothetical protein